MVAPEATLFRKDWIETSHKRHTAELGKSLLLFAITLILDVSPFQRIPSGHEIVYIDISPFLFFFSFPFICSDRNQVVMSEALPWNNDEPLSISQLLKQVSSRQQDKETGPPLLIITRQMTSSQ